jgi:outer membrane protein OmpA-like peptidoglycan-associated protein
VFSGIGYVADPQPILGEPQLSRLATYLMAICEATGAANCQINDAPRDSSPARSTVPVPVVPVPKVSPVRGPDGTITTDIPTGALGFTFGSAELGPAADATLAPLVTEAVAQAATVDITGYASPEAGTELTNQVLSRARADAVAARMVGLGLPSSQITEVTGAGTAGRTPEACQVNGRFDETECAQLRRVVIVITPHPAVTR